MTKFIGFFLRMVCTINCLLFFKVARAGRFGTKGLAITFVSDENDAKVLNDVQDRFEVNITGLPEEIDISSYSTSEIPIPFSLPDVYLIIYLAPSLYREQLFLLPGIINTI